jgi:hypothetical protein
LPARNIERLPRPDAEDSPLVAGEKFFKQHRQGVTTEFPMPRNRELNGLVAGN